MVRKKVLYKAVSSVVRIEQLDCRRLMCAEHNFTDIVEERPDLLASSSSRFTPVVADPADIVWINRANTTAGGAGDTDGFGATFGTFAPTARAVVDAVIVSYEKMIGTFNYSLAGQTYNLTVNMNASQGSGFGASAGLSTSLGGKPKSGTITMGTGTNDGIANNDNGWFVDPTPNESSEFMGAITNAFSGDVQAGSPASGKGDFYTVVCAEMTHCMGLFGSALAGWSSRTTNTGVADTAAAPGFLWVFQGPSIKHLLTSDNAATQDTGSAVHSSEPGNSVVFGGDTYIGAQDQGNALYEFGRRYMVNNIFALMFKDAYGFGTVDPAQFSTGTFYSAINSTTNVVTVRGGGGTSGTIDDIISITRSGSIISVSVDPKSDVAGTGALPGTGDLPAFVTNYDLSTTTVSSISINAAGGNDQITIAADVGIPITVVAGTGTDTLTITGTANADSITITPTTITAGTTVITPTLFESYVVNANGGDDTVVVDYSTGTAVPTGGLTVAGGANSAGDVLEFKGTGLADAFAMNAAGVVTRSGTTTTFNTVERIKITNNTTTFATNVGGIAVQVSNSTSKALFNASQTISTLQLDAGSLAEVGANGNRVLTITALTVAGTPTVPTATLELQDNDMVLATPGARTTIQSLIQAGMNGFDANGLTLWNGKGIRSSAAHSANAQPSLLLDLYTIGVIKNLDLDTVIGPGAHYTTYDGVNLAPFGNDVVLVKYTYAGDTDLNGTVTIDDYNAIDAAFSGLGPSNLGWINGDFDFNGTITIDDYNAIDSGYANQLGVI